MKTVKMLPSVMRTVVSRSLKKASESAMSLSLILDNLNLLMTDERRILLRNEIFKDTHRGERAFVIVNGPSLKRQDLSLLKNEITFVVSGFWKHPIIEQWQPTYYSILDKAFFTDEENIRVFYKELNNRIKDSIFFLPLFRGYEANKKNNYLDHNRTFYVATYGNPFPSVELTSLVQSFQSVSAFALAQAIYMGCSPIYLLGFDHDYLAHRGIDHHFYEGSCISGHRNESVPISDLNPYDGEMEALLKLWKNYRSLKVVAENKNIKVFNATYGGYLDVFDRVNFEDIF